MKLFNVGWSICLIALLFCSSCSKEPVSSFEFDQNNVKAPATINFTNTSMNATEYLWNFGDGVTSTETNPSHEYVKGGDFDITLKAYGEDATNTSLSTITILPNMTGHWNITFTIQDMTFTGRMNLVENKNQTLSGEFALIDDPAYSDILSTSKIDGFSVTIDAMLYNYFKISFQGTVNSNYDSMSGDFNFSGAPSGAWSATKN